MSISWLIYLLEFAALALLAVLFWRVNHLARGPWRPQLASTGSSASEFQSRETMQRFSQQEEESLSDQTVATEVAGGSSLDSKLDNKLDEKPDQKLDEKMQRALERAEAKISETRADEPKQRVLKNYIDNYLN